MHINAQKTEIAKFVILAGDPLRARFMAKKFLKNPILVSNIRNIEFWSGYYKNQFVTIGASGMGIASIGIYAFELFKNYDVEVIVRTGTAGSYSNDLKRNQLVVVKDAYSKNCFFAESLGLGQINIVESSQSLGQLFLKKAKELGVKVEYLTTHTTDNFYDLAFNVQELMEISKAKLVEMESFGLFCTSKVFKKKATSILTISDEIVSGAKLSALEREQKTTQMFELALEVALELVFESKN